MIAIGRGEGLYSTIEYLHSKGFSIDLVITGKANKEYARGEEDFCALASRIGADFKLVDSLNAEILHAYAGLGKADIAISANWKFKISGHVLRLFKLGVLNCHMGQLPDYKGNATANWMILNGESFMYVDVHKMDEGLDTGDIISRRAIAIGDDDYLTDLWNVCNQSMPALFEEAINRLRHDASYRLHSNSPAGLRCYPRLEKDHQIDWRLSATDICRLVRASSRPLSGAFTFLGDTKVTIWRAKAVMLPYRFLAVPGHVIQTSKVRGTVLVACGENVLAVEEITVSENVMAPSNFLKSTKMRLG